MPTPTMSKQKEGRRRGTAPGLGVPETPATV
jgi:hypothetical protein